MARWSRGGTSVYARFAAPLCRGDSDHLGEGGREDAVFVDGVTHYQCPGLRTGRGKKCELRVKSSAPCRVPLVECHTRGAPRLLGERDEDLVRVRSGGKG